MIRASLVQSCATMLVGVALAATAAVSGMTHDAPRGGFAGLDYADRSAVPVNVPTWANTDTARFRGACEAAGDTWPFIPATVILANREGATHRVTWDGATLDAIHATGDTATHDDDRFIVGVCR